MATIQWRPGVNALTTPLSYRIQAAPRRTVGYKEMAADLASANPHFTEEMIKSLAPLMMEWIQTQLINGNQVTFPYAFSFSVSFTGKLDRHDDQLPDDDDMLQVNARPSRPFVQTIRQMAKLERLPMIEKAPMISLTEDTKLKLADVLFAGGVLKLMGSNLDFNESSPDCGCVIAGTWGGLRKQSVYALVANSTVLLVPDIPEQNAPWQNEYAVTLTTRYSEHGALRKGTCGRKLRSPLRVTSLSPGAETGILTGGGEAAAPYASIIDGTASGHEMLRVQAVIDSRSGQLLLSLLDMEEEGRVGAAVTAAANGDFALEGCSGSAVSSLVVRINDHAALLSLVRNSYAGRLVDILDVLPA